MASAPANSVDIGEASRDTITNEVRVDLYLFDLDRSVADVARIGSVLSDDERARADRFLVYNAARNFEVARGTLRRLLGGLVGIAPDAVAFAYGEHGKPALLEGNAALHFNLSHSNNIGAIAVSKEHDIGVDVEVRREVEDGLAERFFSIKEVEALQALDGEARASAFFRCWTRKEAVIKALGEGFSRPLKSFDVDIEDKAQPELLRLDASNDLPMNWRLFSFTPNKGVFGAIACRTSGSQLLVHRQGIAF